MQISLTRLCTWLVSAVLILINPASLGNSFAASAATLDNQNPALGDTIPRLVLPSQLPAAPGTQVVVPVTYQANDNQISSVIFAVEFDSTWLTFDATDGDGDGIPDAIQFSVPPAFSRSATLVTQATTSKINVTILDLAPPLSSLPTGTVMSITLGVKTPPAATQVDLRFSQDPAPSFGSTTGQSVSGSADNGSLLITVPVDKRQDLYLPIINKHPGPTRLTGSQGNNHSPSVSPDGKQIVFISDRDGNNEVYIMNFDGTGQRRLTSTPTIQEDLPSFAPNGATILFGEYYATEASSRREDLYLMNLDGSQRRNLTNTANSSEGRPRFAPDGVSIVFDSDRTGAWEIHTARLQGNQLVDLQQVTSRPGYFNRLPSYSSTGDRILFRAELVGQGPSSSRINFLNVATKSITALPADYTTLFPAWSPDGHWVVFISNHATPRFSVYAMRPDGTTTRNLVSLEADSSFPTFSPDGRWLVFASSLGGSYNIYRLEVASILASGSPDSALAAENESQ